MNSLILPSLPVEIAYLVLSSGLLFVQIALQSLLLTRQFGPEYNAGPRDEQRAVTGIAGRGERALRNFLETFPLFAAAVLAAQVTGRADWWTWLGAALYFWARVAYLPLYLAGIPYLRSAVWGVASLGIVIILWQLAF